MTEFLTGNPVHLNEEEMDDVRRRIEMDEKRVEEQKRFYEIARQRAKELDVHMEKFRRDIVEHSKLWPGDSGSNFRIAAVCVRDRRLTILQMA